MSRDVDADDPTRFSSSGLLSSKGTGEIPRTSWYYVHTLRKRTAGMRFDAELPSGHAKVRLYRFVDSAGERSAVAAPGIKAASLISFAKNDTDGTITGLEPKDGRILIDVGERPVLVMLAGGGSPINSALGKPARYLWRVSAHSGLAGGGVRVRLESMPAEGIILSLSGPDGRNIRSGRAVPRAQLITVP